jgi:nicotinate-nucleotide adenylyltransferase
VNTPLARDPVPRFGDRRRTRVGLLGGSFNPAHAGHRHVAELARRRLGLDQVWLMVSPGNPLKPQRGMASLPLRLASARAVADGRRVVATAIESRLGTRFTIDTLRALQQRFPRVAFVWIAGADIFEQLPRWQNWREIAHRLPFAILPRPGYNHRALAGRAAHALRSARLPAGAVAVLALCAPPAWIFMTAPQHAASASAIRAHALRDAAVREWMLRPPPRPDRVQRDRAPQHGVLQHRPSKQGPSQHRPSQHGITRDKPLHNRSPQDKLAGRASRAMLQGVAS